MLEGDGGIKPSCQYDQILNSHHQYTPPGVINPAIICIAQRRGAHLSPDLLAHLRSSIASMKALVHVHVPRLNIVLYEARAANERRWCTRHVLNTPPAVVMPLPSPIYKHLLHVLVSC